MDKYYKLKDCNTLEELEELENILFNLEFAKDPCLNFYVTVEENGKDYYYTTVEIFGMWVIVTD